MASRSDLIRDGFAAIERGDWLAMRRLYDDDVELWVPPSTEVLEPGVVRGADEVDAWFARFVRVFTEWGFGLAETIEHEPYVIAFGEWQGRGRSSGIAVRGKFVTVYAFRGDRVISIAHHWGRGDAAEGAAT